MIAQERIYTTADKTRTVSHGDVDAAYLLCNKGEEIPEGFNAPGEKVAEVVVEPKRKK